MAGKKHNGMYVKALLLAFKCWKSFAIDIWEDVWGALYLFQVVLTLEAEKFIWNLMLGNLHVQNMPNNVTGESASKRENLQGIARASLCAAPGMEGLPVLIGLFWGAFVQWNITQILSFAVVTYFGVYLLHWTACVAQFLCCGRTLKYINDSCSSSCKYRSLYFYVWGWNNCEAYFRVSWALVNFHMRTWAGRRKISLSRREEIQNFKQQLRGRVRKGTRFKIYVFQTVNFSVPVGRCTSLGHQPEQYF